MSVGGDGGWFRFVLATIALFMVTYGLIAVMAGFGEPRYFLFAPLLPVGVLVFVWLHKRFGPTDTSGPDYGEGSGRDL